MKVINEVYRQYNFHQYPFLLMTLKMKTDSYDVNVTPDKRTIFVHEERQLLESIRVVFLRSLTADGLMLTNLFSLTMPGKIRRVL